MAQEKTPDWLHLPSLKRGSPETTEKVLVTLKESYPEGIPLGRLCGVVLKSYSINELLRSFLCTGPG
jgi:hypothetical protein